MTVSVGGTIRTTFDDGVGGTRSDSGTLSADGTTLTIAGHAFEAERSSTTNEYDFDDDGSDDPATLVIQLTRQ